MPKLPSLIDMLKAGVHLGHKKARKHPFMDQYVFSTHGDLTVIDLNKTLECLESSLEALKNAAQQNQTILFVGTKKQGKTIIKEAAESCNMPYVTNRWIGGTLTNYQIISRQIKKLKTLKDQNETGKFTKYTKKEQLEFTREIEELEELIGGIQNMNKLPDLVFILDLKKDKTALREAVKRNIPVVGICDTNINAKDVDYPIPANDDAIKSIKLITALVTEAVKEGKTLAPKEEVSTLKKAQNKSREKKQEKPEPKKEETQKPKNSDKKEEKKEQPKDEK